MTIVGMISDTHGTLSGQAYAALAGSSFIIHAGDIGGPAILRELETIAPVAAVLGNNDFDEYGASTTKFAHPVVEGVRFLVAHYPRDVRIGFNGCAGLAPGDPLPEVCVHGHTHVPELIVGRDARPASYVVCPGSASFPRSGFPCCVAKAFIEAGVVRGVRVVALDGATVMSVGDCV